MATIRSLLVKIMGDTSGLQKSLGDAQGRMRGAMGSMQGMGKSFHLSMGSSFGIAGLKIAAGISLAVMAIQRFASSMKSLASETMPMYAEQQAATAKLVTIMNQRMGATNEMVKSMLDLADAERSTGVIDDDAIIAGEQQLATFLHTVDALRMLTPAMADLAAQQKGANATSGDLTNIANMMGKALDGNAGALKRVGISFTDAQGKILKTGNEMQRAAMLAEIIKQNIGDMNQALGQTDIGRIAQVNNAFDDVKKTVGGVFTRLIADLAPQLIQIANWLKEAAMWAAALMEVLFGVQTAGNGAADAENKQAKVSTSLAGANSKLAGATDAVAGATSRAAKAGQKWLATFDQINKVQTAKAGGGGGAISLDIGDATGGIASVGDALSGLQEKIDILSKDKGFQDLKKFLEVIWDLVKYWVEGMEIILSSGDAIGTFFKGLWDMIWGGLKWYGEQIGGWFKNYWDAVIVATVKKDWDYIVAQFKLAGEQIKVVWSGIKAAFILSWNGIKSVWGTVSGWFASLWNSISSTATSAWNWIKQAASDAWDWIKGVWSGITGFFSNLWSGISNTFKSSINTVLSGFERSINWIIDKINEVKKAWSDVFGGGYSAIGHISVPRLAMGGAFDRPTLAMIGEAGPEVAIPAGRDSSILERLADLLTSKMGAMQPAYASAGGGSYNFYLDSRPMAAKVTKQQNLDRLLHNGR